MKLKNEYVFGCLVQFYELEMLNEHIQSCIQMLEGIENEGNVTFVFCISTQECYEQIDWNYFQKRYPKAGFELKIERVFDDEFKTIVGKDCGFWPEQYCYGLKLNSEKLYTISDFRRDLCYNWQSKCDLVCWSETDSLWPKQTLHLLEELHESVKSTTPKYVVNFADRKLWDNSFAPLHPMFQNTIIIDELVDEASGKAYMSLERMNEINNISIDEVIVDRFDEPRFDGSCVCFSSELLKSGVNIPHSILLAGEDSAMAKIAKKLMGDNFVQYNFSNVLHVHNRRHPNKRTGVLNEDNPQGFCDERKGDWWTELEKKSKFNLNTLFDQEKFKTV